MARYVDGIGWVYDKGYWNYEEAVAVGSSLADTYGPNRWQPGQPTVVIVVSPCRCWEDY